MKSPLSPPSLIMTGNPSPLSPSLILGLSWPLSWTYPGPYPGPYPAYPGLVQFSFSSISLPSFFAAPRTSKAKRAQMARQLAQDISDHHPEKPTNEPPVPGQPAGKKPEVASPPSSANSSISFEKTPSQSYQPQPAKSLTSTLSVLIQEKSGIKNPFLNYSTYVSPSLPPPLGRCLTPPPPSRFLL